MNLQAVLDLNLPTLILTDANLHHRDFSHNYNDDLGRQFEIFADQNNIQYIGPNFNTYYCFINKHQQQDDELNINKFNTDIKDTNPGLSKLIDNL